MLSDEDRTDHEGGAATPSARPPATRPLMAATDPARRLQELLREQPSVDVPIIQAAPPPPPVSAPIAPLPTIVPPAAPVAPAEIIRLSITLDGARLDPLEYAGREALPSRAELEQAHRAYVLRDQWAKSDAGAVWMVYMRRKSR